MAKAKTIINAPKVPDAEPVGDPAQFKSALSGEAASADLLPSAEATATGVAAPVATNSTATETAGGVATGESSTDNVQDNVVTDTAGSDLETDTQKARGGLSKADADAIMSQILGIAQPDENREFYVLSPVRHNNIRYAVDEAIVLTEAEHAPLHEKRLVGAWVTGLDMD